MCFRLALLGLKNMCLKWKTNIGHLGSLMIISICSFNLSYILILILSWFFLDHFELARSIYLFRRRWGIASKRSIRKFPSKCEQLEISFFAQPAYNFQVKLFFTLTPQPPMYKCFMSPGKRLFDMETNSFKGTWNGFYTSSNKKQKK